MPFIGEKMLHRTKQIRAKPALLAIRGGEATRFDDPGKKGLRKILRIVRRISPAAYEGVERIPIRPAKRLERLSRAGLIRLARLNRTHQAPMRCDKFMGSGRITHTLIVT